MPANQVINQTLDVPSGANVSVAADLVGGAPVLTPFANDVSAVPEGSARVTVRHAADAPAVNVLVNGEIAIPNLAAGAQASAVLPAGTYDVTGGADRRHPAAGALPRGASPSRPPRT